MSCKVCSGTVSGACDQLLCCCRHDSPNDLCRGSAQGKPALRGEVEGEGPALGGKL